MVQPILELHNITKAFGPKVANSDVCLAIRPGIVHALVGENGAGKTTLMNMVSGNLQPDSGQILFDGQQVVLSDPKAADALGIGMVHQHFKLIPSLTVAANVFLGREILTRHKSLDTAAMEQRVRELSQQFGLKLNPKDVVEDLSVGERQRVEIIKALSHQTQVLILDEPTAVLTPAETDDLFVVVRRLASEGCAIVFISHKLGEVLSISDEVTVIRDGKVVGTRAAAGLSKAEIASMMVGREVLLRIEHTPAEPGEEVLAVKDLYAIDARGAIAVNNLSLQVHSGEIVGIAGVEGNGQAELAAAIAGMRLAPRGQISLLGNDITKVSVQARRKAGLTYIPEDRHHEGAAPGLSVADNLAATHLQAPLTRSGILQLRKIRDFATGLINRFDVRGATPETVISTLSGGNMQKVIIAREFAAQPKLLLVSQPTRGVDVGAMEFVHNSIVKARDDGAGVLLLSADLSEVMSLADRLLVIYRGEIIAEFTQESMTELAVGLAMAGVKPTDEALATAQSEHLKVQQVLAEEAAEVKASGVTPTPKLSTSPPLAASSLQTVAAAAQPPQTTPPASAPTTTKVSEAVPIPAVKPWYLRLATAASPPLIAIGIALLVGAIVILAIGKDPVKAYVALFASGWKTPYGIAQIVASFIPLSIMSAAVILSFRAGFFNIGGEGQLYLGAFFGAWAGFTFTSLPKPLLIVVILIAGAIAGALWGFIPGALLAFWDVNIIVTTLLMSNLAILLTQFFVSGPFRDATIGFQASVKIAPGTQFTMFDAKHGIGPDLVIALLVAVALGLLLTRTIWGLRVRELGEMNRFAQYTGVSPKAMSIQVMMISGAAAGLAGSLFVLGPNGGRFLQMFSPGYGFLAITVALLARLNPWASLVAAVFYATMMSGATGLQASGVPYPLVNVLQGLIIVLITASFLVTLRKRKVAPKPTPATTEEAAS